MEKEIFLMLNGMLESASEAQRKALNANEAIYHRAEKETIMKIISLLKEQECYED